MRRTTKKEKAVPSLELEFECFCAVCGAGICNSCEEGRTPKRGMPFLQITPCEQCMERAKEEARQAGYDAGHSDGEAKGWRECDESHGE